MGIVGEAILLPIKNSRIALNIGWMFFLLLFFIAVLGDMDVVPSLVFLIPQAMVSAYIAFAWHRFVLLGDENALKQEGLAEGAGHAISKGGIKFMWTGVGFTIGLWLGYVILLIISIYGGTLGSVLSILLFLISLPFLCRMYLVFPAIAIGHTHHKIKDAIAASKGSGAKILSSYVLVTFFGILIILLPMVVLTSVTFAGETVGEIIFFNLLYTMINVYFIMVWASVNSLVFKGLCSHIEDYYIIRVDEFTE